MKTEKYIKSLQNDKVSIFLFHGVIKSNPFRIRNYNRKHIFENEFYNLLVDLKANGSPVSMNTLINQDKFPPNPFIISFDDGFENNYSVAAPILDFLKIPAVFYITSGFVNENLMSWIDQIDYAIELTRKKSIKVSFFENDILISSDVEKTNFLIKVRTFAKQNKSFFLRKEYYIKEIFEVCEVNECFSQNTTLDLKMNWNQVLTLSKNDIFTIGGHTHTHPIMSYLDNEQLVNEVVTPLNFLKEIGIGDLDHFSYPEGLDYCYNENVIQVLKDNCIKCCPTAIDGVNEFGTDLFHLKRITVI